MEPLPFDPYKELEVDPAASQGTIDAAWKALLKRHHPDRAHDPDAAVAKAKRLNQAHDVLSDPLQRGAYDLERIQRARAMPPSRESSSTGPTATWPPSNPSPAPTPAPTSGGPSPRARRSSPSPAGPAVWAKLGGDRWLGHLDALKGGFVRVMGSRLVAGVAVAAAILWLRVALTYYSSDEVSNDVTAVAFGALGGGLAYARGMAVLGWAVGCAIVPPALIYVVCSPYIGKRAEPFPSSTDWRAG